MCLIVARNAAMLSECKRATAEIQAEIKVLAMKPGTAT
jgi:hypothetical protein